MQSDLVWHAVVPLVIQRKESVSECLNWKNYIIAKISELTGSEILSMSTVPSYVM